MADYPFYDKQPGPERREKLNELYATWEAAIGSIVKGDSGWSPLIRAVVDGSRYVLELYDWVDGQGTKPTTTGYLGATGYVTLITDALDFRGPTGVKGDIGDAGPSNVLQIGTVESGITASATITGTSPSQTLNLVLPKGDTGNDGVAATIDVGTVTTGAAGTNAQVTNIGTLSAAVFDFVIPKGADGSGAGDMLKADYDSVGDGVVNAARAVPWTGISGKPIVIAAGATKADAKTSIDLQNVDNTSDADKPVSTAQATALSNKVDKVAGKGLSTEDFTTAEKSKLGGIAAGATANQTDAYLLDRANHTGSQAISTVTGLQTALDSKQANLVSGTNIKTINGESVLGSGNITVTGGGSAQKKFYFYTANNTTTVPAGVSTLRFYAGGRGGSGAGLDNFRPGGGGGGFAFGDIAVTPGDSVSVEFSAGVATVKLNGTVAGTANPGSNGVGTTSGGATGGVGGTASIAGFVTNGGAYTGGKGGDVSSGASGGRAAGGSCGSPLGNGFQGGSAVSGTPLRGGGAGIGGRGADASSTLAGGGGAGEAGTLAYGGGSTPGGSGRGIINRFTDPLLEHAVFPRTPGNPDIALTNPGSPGAGGYGANGGDFGGGGGNNLGGNGGLMGGGGSSEGVGGAGGYGAGGGAGGSSGGAGGAAFCFFYY